MSEQVQKQFHIHSRFLHPSYACIARPHWSKNIVVPVLNWQRFGRRVIRGPVIRFKDEPIGPRFAGKADIAPRERRVEVRTHLEGLRMGRSALQDCNVI